MTVCAIETCDEFVEHITEMAVNSLFNGKLSDIAIGAAQIAMAFGSDDAERLVPVLPVLVVWEPDKTGNTLAFIASVIGDGGIISYIGADEVKVIPGFGQYDANKAFIRKEVLNAVLEGKPFAKTVVLAALRVAMITREQKRADKKAAA